MSAMERWWLGGSRVQLTSVPHRIFARVEGEDGPWTTFFHGFPSSSFDWASLLPRLPPGRRRLVFDHLGFGDSDKPRPHVYSFDEQIEIALAVWDARRVRETVLVAHDYSVSMAQEILARIAEDSWSGPRIQGVVLLNGGLFFSRQTPLLIQRLLRGPLGPLVSRLVTRRAFDRSFTRVFAPAHAPTRQELDDQWASIVRRDGLRVYHLLSRYHEERQHNEPRWTRAIAETRVPLRFGWGMLDPVSGAPMIAAVRALRPDADVQAWEDLGHYPQIEAPDRVGALIAAAERPVVEPRPSSAG